MPGSSTSKSTTTLLMLLSIVVVVATSSLSLNSNLNDRGAVVDAFQFSTPSTSTSQLKKVTETAISHSSPGAASHRLFMAKRYHAPEDDVHAQDHLDNSEERLDNHDELGRRSALGSMSMIVGGGLMSTLSMTTTQSVANAVEYSSIDGDEFVPAPRPTAYRVDSTQPPTLIPLDTARKEKKVLMELGRGSGTNKEEIVDDSLNLNNMLNKAIFGTIDSVERAVGSKKDESKIGPGYASFVCLGLPTAAKSSPADIDLAISLSSTMIQGRKKSKNGIADTAFGLAFCPLSVQPALDDYSKTGDFNPLQQAMVDSGVDETTIAQYRPLLRFVQQQSLDLLAMSPEYDDIKAARKDGLQNVDVSRRQLYVSDPNGFIAQTKDPEYKLYTDRSLLKDLPSNEYKVTGFFAERILVHETGATVLAKYAVRRPEAFVMMVAPIPDVRYLLGINGRIPRICKALNPEQNKVNDDAVTTILLNPTAEETLSQSRFLRLEIGTGPETLDYQTKVADYLWFSSSPKVNMIPRLMNPK